MVTIREALHFADRYIQDPAVGSRLVSQIRTPKQIEAVMAYFESLDKANIDHAAVIARIEEIARTIR
jgi:ribosome-binding factor A